MALRRTPILLCGDPRGVRVERRLRFTQHFLDAIGKWRVVEQRGPPTIEVWRPCWEVFAQVAISSSIAQPGALTRFALKFEERANKYSKAWHMCFKADELCRSEFWTSERRRQIRFQEARAELSKRGTIDAMECSN